jgi:hypothetical protein
MENLFIKNKENFPSKRSIIKGRVCSSFKLNYLNEIRNKIGMHEFDLKRSVVATCIDIELFLRYKQIKNNNNPLSKISFEYAGFKSDF